MDFKILEARRFFSLYYKAGERTVKDYEIDIERTDGRLYRYCGVEYTLSRGDVLFRTPGGTVSSVGAQESYILTLDFSEREHVGVYSRNIAGETQMTADNELICRLQPVIHPRDTGALLEIYRTLIGVPDRSSSAARSLVLEILHTLNAEISHLEYESVKPGTGAVDTVIAYMLRHLSEPLSLDALSEVARLEKSYFVRLFRKMTGKTPIEMLVEMRLDHACDLVATTDMKIFDIAIASGYRTPSFFISEYKKRFGFTPNKHRLALINNKMK